MNDEGERRDLEGVALQNAASILRVRQRAEADLLAAREDLRTSNQRLLNILESIPDGFVVLDKDWHFTYLNPTAERLLAPIQQNQGRTLLGKTLWGAFPDLAGTRVEAEYRKAMAGENVAFETFHATLAKWLDIRAFPTEDGISIDFQDITSRKQAEEALRESNEFNRTVIDSSRDCIKKVTLEGVLTWISDSGRRALKIDGKTDEVVGQSWIGFWQGEDRQAAQEAVAKAAEGEIGGFVGQFAVAGEPRWWDVVITPIRDAQGRPCELLAVSRDISERVAAESERKQLLESERAARAAAERASQMKDEFLATLSHELRTPLGAILGWAQILQRSGDRTPEEVKKGLETIERNARIQTQLIEDLLDMSRITSGKVRLDVQTVEPVSFIEAAVEALRPAAEAKGLRIEKMLDPLAGPVAGDPHRLQQVVWNLISNAVKFTPRGGKVQVALYRVNSHLEIAVSDTGAGIEPQFLPHLFERFRQADSSTTRHHGGLGLGLSIVKHLAELHGGSIKAQSDGPGRGATFTVCLPIAAVRHIAFNDDRVHPKAPLHQTKFGPVDLTGLKILVVDDEPDGREIVRRVLSECNAQVTTAGSGQEALNLVEQEKPDVLISDIGMPEMDGFEFLKRLRALQPANREKIPAIALTAFARSEDRTRSLRAGFLVHVSKPVEPTELIATVASVAGRAGGG